MKKLFSLLGLAFALAYCNTPQTTTTNTGMDTTMSTDNNMNQTAPMPMDTSMHNMDTSMMSMDTTMHHDSL